jgi:hypothetical protein
MKQSSRASIDSTSKKSPGRFNRDSNKDFTRNKSTTKHPQLDALKHVYGSTTKQNTPKGTINIPK